MKLPVPLPEAMTFLLDQSTDARLLPYLRDLGHDATRIGSDYPSGVPDEEVLAISQKEGRILITDDRDFGELIFRRGYAHCGVIFLRLGDYAELSTKIERLSHTLTNYQAQLNQFLVVTRRGVRVRQIT
jgi:predicted nuclease of predicted toxin-antitoxin system